MKQIKKILFTLVAVAIISASTGTLAKAIDPNPRTSSNPVYTLSE